MSRRSSSTGCSPLVGVCRDEGETWEHIRDIADSLKMNYAYTSITFVGERVLITYRVNDDGCTRFETVFESIPVSWFYED